MSARQPRWEIVRSAAGWHARFIAANGEPIVSSEVYKRKRSALRALEALTEYPLRTDLGWPLSTWRGDKVIEVREVDER